MEQETRNKLQRATQQVRRILEQEFAEQLEGTFDVLPDGTILPEPGKHLDARQRLTRQKLVEAIEHIKAGGKNPREAVDEYTREAAFTFLNRFVALRMLEARGMLQECVSQGDASSGFKEFCGLAPGLSSLDDGGYRLYLECLFDELTVEVKVLFNRRDAASLLWPRRGALTGILDVLDQDELAAVWSEDETIGWVYQYFNSDEDRQRARYKPNGKPKAPGNSYELAVRNQFFTPRYVVEFLTDNTLGRIWYEMRKGKSRLVKECQYLVRRPSEVSLDQGQELPAEDIEEELNFSQEQLLKKTVYIPHRPKKDPRDLKILDPACGSGHFLLYAFDLLVSIYYEAWEDEASPKSEATGKCLREDYLSLKQLHAALPGLVLTHNLHGIDIDPRAAQIAAMALWMRGQREFSEFSVSREQRPTIARSNIVCAEPMPGETAFLDEFIVQHLSGDAEGRFLASLVRKVFQAMLLAGEVGSLLKIEEDIAEEVAEAKKKWLERPEYRQRTLFDDGPTTVQQELDLTIGISDEAFWGEAEDRIYDALRVYSEHAERSGGFQRRLFAADAARGFAFIDLCRERYDVVLMNPPFGEVSEPSREYLYNRLPETARDLFAGFVKHFCMKLATGGRLGALTNRTAFFSDFLADWRLKVLAGEDASLRLMADLGYGVLDAVVEAAAYVCERSAELQAVFINALSEVRKDQRLQHAVRSLKVGDDDQRVYTQNVGSFSRIPDMRFAYHLGDRWISLIADNHEHPLYVSRAGLTSGDDFRFLRLSWETPDRDVTSRWKLLAKGGEFGRYLTNLHLKIDWSAEGFLSRTRNSELYGRPGVTYTERTTSNLSARVLNSGCCFSGPGPGIIPRNKANGHIVLAFINSFAATYCLEALVGGGDFSVKGSAARHLEPGYINHFPTFPVSPSVVEYFQVAMEELVRQLCDLIVDETHPLFRGQLINVGNTSLEQISETLQHYSYQKLSRCYEIVRESESRIASLLSIAGGTEAEAFSDTGWPWPDGESKRAIGSLEQFKDLDAESTQKIPNQMVGREVHFRFQNKLAHYLHAGVEAISHELGVSPEQVCVYLASHSKAPRELQQRVGKTLLSLSFGVVLGHWPETIIGAQLVEYDAECIFDQLPDQQPGRRNTSSIHTIVVCDDGHPNDASNLVEKYLNQKLGNSSTEVLQDIKRGLLGESGGDGAIGAWFRKHFFEHHIKAYSKSRRKAPIYWQFATPTGSYSVWLYYHHFTKDTFFKVLNEYVDPKLKHELQKLERFRSEAGTEPTSSQRKEIEEQEKFVAELAAMVEESERIAPLWNPNLNDGVIINFAPLWRLVPHNKSWQKECKKVWDKLVKGDYDWAHLAMHLWPERVVPKCVTDASFAIAHGLEELLWVMEANEKLRPLKEPEEELADQVVLWTSRNRAKVENGLSELSETSRGKEPASSVYASLGNGEHDENPAALFLWPDRVIKKCFEDRTLRKTHGLILPAKLTEKKKKAFLETYVYSDCSELRVLLKEALATEDRPFAEVWSEFKTGIRDEDAISPLLWPERVIGRCDSDHHLAVTHGIERYLWHTDRDGTARRRQPIAEEVASEIDFRISPAVKAALESLLDAPAPAASSRKRKTRTSGSK